MHFALQVINTFTEAVQTVNPKQAVGKVHTLWVAFAKFYEENDQIPEVNGMECLCAHSTISDPCSLFHKDTTHVCTICAHDGTICTHGGTICTHGCTVFAHDLTICVHGCTVFDHDGTICAHDITICVHGCTVFAYDGTTVYVCP